MEATFDNKANVLNAKLHAAHDNSVIYSITTDQAVFSRKYTYVRDTNPALGGDSTIVGVINWGKKTFEINGQRKALGEVRRKVGGFRNKSRFWKWTEDRDEYNVVHREDGWEATCTRTGIVEATFAVPYRPQLFGKTTPVVLSLSRVALAKDEVFLILVFIYCEIKRQEKTNSAGGW
ncbi:hypothetical protein GALMADRAFT_160249 [Galerina marginata CBS 339.88]|uniref:DUF6593 domain-containing protein n=1 Tax=Galerina marginata (strain CBS 339.88) TaxID=685588 RepID=A0A067SI91_GALM3|nr:hypothetical protein GALMADRAFT_160249 [Galerina marginata CBS 339.88]